jgi:hypothetical protein
VNILKFNQIAIISSIFLLAVILTAGFYSVNRSHPFNVNFINAAMYQRTPTPDGSNQTVHPSIVYFPGAWNGWRYWLAITPYPNGNNKYENPSILVGNDSAIKVNGGWQTPAGLKNPIVSHPPGGNYADPELIYNNDTDELWLYYCDGPALTLQRSSDGVHWTQPRLVLSWSGKTATGMSYSVVKQGHDWYMWYMRGKSIYRVEYRRSSDGLNWSSARNVTFTPEAQPWHLDVKYIPSMNEYWMFFCASESDMDSQFQGGSLYFAESVDRVNWVTMEKPILTINPLGWDNERIYRSTFDYDSSSGIVHLWYSARSLDRGWHIGYATSKLYSK